MKTKIQPLKGFRDFLPDQSRIRNYVLGVLQNVFESYGFEPLETPTLEYASTLLGKYGEEADKLVYTFKDKGRRKVGLRYDLTVPVARVLAQYNQQLVLPFKRYQIQNVFRAEKPQKGRFREFLQCDIDIFGVTSPLADAEIIAVIYESLKKLGFKKFTTQINSRQVLFRLLESLGLKDSKKQLFVLQSVDKLEKQGKEKVTNELVKKGLKSAQIKDLFEKINKISPDENLEKLFGFLESFGMSSDFYKFVPSMVRGLDYYTGPIFETVVSDPAIGSLTGGGRYDNLIAALGGPNIPGTGTTIGFDRICQVINEKNLLPNIVTNSTQVLVLLFPGYEGQAIKTVQQFRQKGISSSLYLEERPVEKQLKYANQKNIPFVVLLGPDEVKQNKLALKNMKDGKQKLLTLAEATKVITSSISLM